MNISVPIGAEIVSVGFGFYDGEDVERISVKQIANPTVFDNLGHPTSGGLYDLVLGPFLGKTTYRLFRNMLIIAAQRVTSMSASVLAISDTLSFLSLSIILYYSNR